jgi:hypothetical protein
MLLDEGDGLLAVERDQDFEAVRGEELAVVADELLVVIDDEEFP